MAFRTVLATAAAAALLALPAFAEGIEVHDPYARAASPVAKSGAAFMEIVNAGPQDDRLVGVASDIAARVELHTHVAEGDVMRMVHVEEGFPLAAGETLRLARGGRHVMLMGLARPLEQGDSFELTLRFERAGDMTIGIPVDLERQPPD